LHGVSTQLSWEAYMRCAIGICGACDHGGKVLCMDGPVLRTPYAMAGVE
jgi:dihydroorotate dehydrogenase electron transfer subunit